MLNTSGYIYAVAAEGLPLIKIGCSKRDAQKRLHSLRVGQPFGLTLIASVFVEEHVHQVEKALHRFFQPYHKRGEWFEYALDADTFTALVHQAAAGALPDPTLPSSFGARLKQFREARDWTLQELAERSGVPYETIYRVERGTHQEPRVSIAGKLARTLGVSLDVLVGLYEDIPKSI